jgi:uncharacterized repeat protein (TIGR02543 family)
MFTACSTNVSTFTVSFNSNGGNPVESILVEEGLSVGSIEDPSRDGYRFADWYIDSSFNVIFDDSKVIDKDIELYAKWDIINYNIIYNLNGGTNDVTAPKNYDISSSFDLPAPSKTRYKFLGWYTSEDFNGDAISSILQGGKGDLVLYAKWEEDNIFKNTYLAMTTYIHNLGYNDLGVAVLLGSDTSEGYTYLETDTDPYNLNNSSSRPNNYGEIMTDALAITKEVFKRLGFSQSVWTQMTSTTAIMGAKTATENGITATWTYHPDKGLEIIYTFAD